MATLLGGVALVAAFVVSCSAQIDPGHSQKLTVYHLNPATAGALPVNMDTGDARGDLYFYLGQFLLPLECANASKEGRSHFDCDNPERVDPNLVVTKVDMEIDSRMTIYSACNLCNGTDPFTHKPCETGSYTCDCFNYHKSGKCEPTRVGAESIKDSFFPHHTPPQCASALHTSCGDVKTDSKKCGACLYMHYQTFKKANCTQEDYYDFCPSQYAKCNATSPAWMCWTENIPRKTEGEWYSTLKDGLCNATSPAGSCGWKVLGTRTVKDKCLKEKIMSRVEANATECFGACGPRNTNSSCWIGCFFDTLLGPQARHSNSVPLSGIPISEIEEAWTDAFLPEEQGGCPVQGIPVTWDLTITHSESALIV
jgi:hypothetical protein